MADSNPLSSTSSDHVFPTDGQNNMVAHLVDNLELFHSHTGTAALYSGWQSGNTDTEFGGATLAKDSLPLSSQPHHIPPFLLPSPAAPVVSHATQAFDLLSQSSPTPSSYPPPLHGAEGSNLAEMFAQHYTSEFLPEVAPPPANSQPPTGTAAPGNNQPTPGPGNGNGDAQDIDGLQRSTDDAIAFIHARDSKSHSYYLLNYANYIINSTFPARFQRGRL